MCTVCTPSHVWCTVHLNMIDHKRIHIQSLHIGIRLCVLQQLEQEFSRLDGPSSLGASMGFGLSFAANSSIEASKRDDLFLSQHIFKIPVCFSNVHLLDGLSCLSSILEMNSEIRTSSFA